MEIPVYLLKTFTSCSSRTMIYIAEENFAYRLNLIHFTDYGKSPVCLNFQTSCHKKEGELEHLISSRNK